MGLFDFLKKNQSPAGTDSNGLTAREAGQIAEYLQAFGHNFKNYDPKVIHKVKAGEELTKDDIELCYAAVNMKIIGYRFNAAEPPKDLLALQSKLKALSGRENA